MRKFKVKTFRQDENREFKSKRYKQKAKRMKTHRRNKKAGKWDNNRW